MADTDATQRIPDDPALGALAAGRVVFGRYTLLAIAGRGGMGVVWRARDEELELEVALKFLPEAVAADKEAVRDLKRETRRCRELAHPHIVRVHDFIQQGGLAAISMEFVEGESLAGRKAEAPGGCLGVAELAPLAAQLCSALDYAHTRAKIAHRDLKPANLLVTRAGELKVTDFGIARSLTETQTRLTGTTGGTSGTLPYMSPQHLAGDRPTESDDIYALGATLYELLTGKPPFYRGDAFSLMTQIRERAPAPPAEHRAEADCEGPEIPAAWAATMLACLEKNPTRRPASVAAVAARLGLSGAGLPLKPAMSGAEQGVPSHDETVVIKPTESSAVLPPSPSLWRTSQPAVPGRLWIIPDLGLTLMPIASGIFTMGSENGSADEKPLTKVTITQPFWMGKTEVTQREWRAIMGSNPSNFEGDDLPVEQVSWEEAMEFCRKLTVRERAADRLLSGYTYTLPTEAQWEYACRSGTTGDYAGDLDAMGWYDKNSGSTTHAVAQKTANAWGLYDMHGNVWEWCADWYADKLPGGSVTDPKGAASGSDRFVRGGCWFNVAASCRSAFRLGYDPGCRDLNLGFRLVLSPQVSP